MLLGVPVRPCQEQTPVGVVGAGGPDLLAIDDPAVSYQLRPRHGAGEIGARARLAEQLAPNVLAGQAWAKERLLLRVRAVGEQGLGREVAHAGAGDAHGADAADLLVDDDGQRRRQIAAVPGFGPGRRGPAGIDQFGAPFDEAKIWVPVGLEPGADVGAHGLFGGFGHGRSVRHQCPHACSMRSRCQVGSPRKTSELLARLNQRWVSLSQVKPIPPWIWIAWMAVCR